MSNEVHQDDFSPFFVDREKELEELLQWAKEETVPRRLRTITGPPGYGKSWLLHRFEESLYEEHDHNPCVIRVPTEELGSREKMTAWVANHFIPAVQQKCCSTIPNPPPTASLEEMISNSLQELCQTCKKRLILIVDGLDELPDDERKDFEKQFLEKFWEYETCLRIISAFRDELGLSSPNLRRGEKRVRLNAFEPEIGYEQLQKRATEAPLPQDLPLIQPYNWTHPELNTRLYETARQKVQNQQPLLFTAGELNTCWVSFIQDKLGQNAGQLTIVTTDLQAISGIGDSWILETFATAGHYSQSEALARLNNLMALSIVAQAGGQRYQVVDGLRELLRAELQLKDKEEK